MISVTEQELKTNIDNILSYVLSNKKLLEEQILVDIPEDVRISFINTYCTETGCKGTPIEIMDTFPQTPPTTCFILLQFEASEEDDNYTPISGLEGDITFSSEGDMFRENALVKCTDGHAYLTTLNPILKVYSIQQTSSFTVIDKHTVEIPYFDWYASNDKEVTICYSSGNSSEGTSHSFGVNLLEKVSVDFISSNLNTLKCLYAILLYIQIVLRQSLSNNGNIYLPHITIQGNDIIQELNSSNASLGQQLYYRRMEIMYHTTQAINSPTGGFLDNITLEGGSSNA